MKKEQKVKYIFDPIKIDKRLRYAERSVLKADISKENKRLILGYKDYIETKKKLSKDRVVKWMSTLVPLAGMLNRPFDKATIRDIERLDKLILESGYSNNTKNDFERMLKCFYKWVKSKDKNTELDEFPPEVKHIKVIRAETKPLRNDQVINWNDVIILGKHCRNIRDRAFIKTLWESCNRIREHLCLKVGDVIDDDGLILNTQITKTGRKTFQKPIEFAEADLREWLEYHPKGKDPEAPLWIRIDGRKPNEAIDYFYVGKMLRTVRRRAGLNKRVNPHNFRHGSLTYHSQELSDSQVKYLAGWTQGTRMLDTYLHPGLDSIRTAKRRMMGKERNEKPPENLFAKCPVCGKKQDKSRVMCFSCKSFLDDSVAKKRQALLSYIADSFEKFMTKNSDVKGEFEEFMHKKIGLEDKSK